MNTGHVSGTGASVLMYMYISTLAPVVTGSNPVRGSSVFISLSAFGLCLTYFPSLLTFPCACTCTRLIMYYLCVMSTVHFAIVIIVQRSTVWSTVLYSHTPSLPPPSLFHSLPLPSSGLFSSVSFSPSFLPSPSVLLQHHSDPSIRNTDGKTALDLAEPLASQALSGEYKRNELLEAAR